jgi:hypothetical protein
LPPGGWRLILHLDHQFECNKHGVLPALQSPLGNLTRVSYQRDVHVSPGISIGIGFDDSATNEDLRDKCLHRAAIIEDGTDEAADAAANAARPNVAFGA